MVFENIQSIEPQILIKEVDIPIVDFKVINGQFDLMQESPINDSKNLQVIRILGAKELYIGVSLFLLDSLGEIRSNQVRVMSLGVGELGQFSPCHHSEIRVKLILHDFCDLVSSQVQVEEYVGKRLVSVVRVDPNTVDNSQSIVQKQRTIKTPYVLIRSNYHGCIESGQAGLVRNNSICEMVGSCDVLVQNEGVLSDTIVLFLNVVGNHFKDVCVHTVKLSELFGHGGEGIVGCELDVQVVAGKGFGEIMTEHFLHNQRELFIQGFGQAERFGRNGCRESYA